jgi:alpha-D-xyloside xylohydrolase
VFPDPAGMLARLHDRGLKICVWINPYIGERSHLFEEGLAGGFLLRRPNGDVYQRDRWQAGMAYVDFTHPGAVRWYQGELAKLLAMGVDAFKTDFGEEIPTDVAYHDGSDPERMHNYYTYLYNRAVFSLLEAERGPGEAVVFARSATATCQRFPVHWGGDCYGNFGSMAESLRGGLSLGLCGFGFWSHDIGGFEDKAPPAVYKRWVAFGLLSSHSRLHGSSSVRVPWVYDEESVEVVRRFTELKCRLMPYLMGAAVEAHRSSIPVLRAMILEVPEDPTCRTLDRQYCLGAGLIVAPVFHERRAEYYLPRGEHVHLLSGAVRPGERWYAEDVDFLDVPVYVRPNAVIPLGDETRAVEYDYAKSPSLLCGCLDGRTPVSIPIHALDGRESERFELTQEGPRVTVTATRGSASFRVVLPWASAVHSVEGGESVPIEARPPSRPADPAGGVVVRATAARVAFTWERR